MKSLHNEKMVKVSLRPELSALGAFFSGGLAVKIFPSLQDLEKIPMGTQNTRPVSIKRKSKIFMRVGSELWRRCYTQGIELFYLSAERGNSGEGFIPPGRWVRILEPVNGIAFFDGI